MPLKGIVLAGGLSSRFGTDKALAIHEGQPFLKKAVGLLTELDLRPAVITRENKRYDFLNCPVLEDKLPDLGPLGGLYTAMSAFPHPAFLVLTCDMPLLTSAVLSELITLKRKSGELALFDAKGGLQPFPGIYPRTLIPRIRQNLLQGRRSLKELLGQSSIVTLSWKGEPDVFANVNTPADLLI